jgi:hypothetical protein
MHKNDSSVGLGFLRERNPKEREPDTPNQDPQNVLAFSYILRIIIFHIAQVFSYLSKPRHQKINLSFINKTKTS